MLSNVNKKIKKVCVSIILGILMLGLSACMVTDPRGSAATPDQAAEYVMESLSDLDLKTFNAYTDNYVDTYRNWIGIPTKKEYKIFNELLQKRRLNSRRAKHNQQFTEKILEHLSWEITDVETDEECAKISMNVTNLDMTDVIGEYTIGIVEDMTAEDVWGPKSAIRIAVKAAASKEGLIAIIDSLDENETRTVEITVSAYKEDGTWKLHLSDEFINAFTGNVYTGHFSEEVERRIHELEQQYESGVEDWADEFETNVEQNVDRWFE